MAANSKLALLQMTRKRISARQKKSMRVWWGNSDSTRSRLGARPLAPTRALVATLACVAGAALSHVMRRLRGGRGTVARSGGLGGRHSAFGKSSTDR